MACLRDHVPAAKRGLEEADDKLTSTVVSGVDPQEVISWMTAQKDTFTPIDADIRDAKRRVNAAKPKKSKKQRVGDSGSSSDGGGA